MGNIMPSTLEPPWEELHANLRAFIGRRVRNQADVDDLVQRVLLQIVRGLSSIRDTERLHAWVYRTARNVIVDHYRSATVRREVASGAATDIEDAQQTAALPEAAVDDEGTALSELATCLAPMLERLPPAHRDAIKMTELDGLNQADAARRSGVSVSGMKSRVQRGRRQLKTLLDQCCRIQLDRRGGVVAYAPRAADGCGPCGDC
jgi:RNA polymerase sigma-70 factor (ECF subfamily)